MKTVIIILFCLIILGSVLFVLHRFGVFNKYLNKALATACRKDDVRWVIRLLQLGANPNTTIAVEEYDYVPGLSIMDQPYTTTTHYYPMLDVCFYSEKVKKLLRAFGGKTKEELYAEQEALREAQRAEEERMRPIREAQKKAEEEKKVKIVNKFLSSRGLTL